MTKFSLEGSRESHEDTYDVLRQSLFFDNLSYFVGQSFEFPMKLHALKLTIGFQLRLAHTPSSWLVNQATLLPRPLVKQGFDT